MKPLSTSAQHEAGSLQATWHTLAIVGSDSKQGRAYSMPCLPSAVLNQFATPEET